MRVPLPQWIRPTTQIVVALSCILAWTMVSHGSGGGGLALAPPVAHAAGCALDSGPVKHVIYVQFDNVHFTRDNPNVPSDLEQMPHLLNFLQGKGTVLTNHHTPLIAHTGTDILTSLTGVYGDRMGVPVSNSFRYFKPDGTTSSAAAFAYWTDPIPDTSPNPTDTSPLMLAETGKVAPAPWVPFTRAGCNVGVTSTANMILENIATDIPTVFGADSPEAAKVKSDPAQAFADYVGIGIHCAAGATLCSSANGGRPDLLADEPGGYTGYNGLFGHVAVAPRISPSGPLKDLDGNVIKDATGHIGFPGFDGMTASVTLAYTAAMQEAGTPVTYSYISDAHDNHDTGRSYGPGSAGYVAALKSYDNAWNTFFTRLASDGMDSTNTLFVVTSDENDHFVGGAPVPTACDGVTIPCTYQHIGELNTNLAGLMATQQGILTPFTAHSDTAPTIYLTGHPGRTDPVVRAFEQALPLITATDPRTGRLDPVMRYQADPVEMRILHMVTADPNRTPTVTMFADPNYNLFAGNQNCSLPCVVETPTAAWMHGDISPDINTTWLGLAGPGVRNLRLDNTTWSDHTDIRPTIMALTGLKDDYLHDGRVLTQVLEPTALAPSMRTSLANLQAVGDVYKALNSVVGAFGYATLAISTRALSSTSEPTYNRLEAQLQAWGAERDALVAQMRVAIEAAEFSGQPLTDAQAASFISQGNDLLIRVNLAANQVP